MQEIYENLARYKLIPVIAIESAADALPLADALIAGGLPVAEITCRTQAAAEAIKSIRSERPDMIVGAGTVLTTVQAMQVTEAGAQFAVAPGYNPNVVAAAQRAGLPFAPGIMTPSDVEGVLQTGIRVMKFFPAGAAGGPPMLKSISAPYSHLNPRFIPTGGVNARNLADYLSLPAVLACGGTWIAKKADIAAGNWDTITNNCREALQAAGVA